MDELDIKMSEFEKELHELHRKVIKFICLEIEKECIKNKWSFRYAFCNPKITQFHYKLPILSHKCRNRIVWGDFGGSINRILKYPGYNMLYKTKTKEKTIWIV